MTLTQALLISLWVFLVQSRVLGYATLSLRFSPLVTGLVVGLILGDVPQALSVSALLQLVYLGVFAPGGPMPAEPCFASATAVSVVLLGNLPPVAGILIAIPVGIYSGKLYTLRYKYNTAFMSDLQSSIDVLDDRSLTRNILIRPILASFFLFVPLLVGFLLVVAPSLAQTLAGFVTPDVTRILNLVTLGVSIIGMVVMVTIVGQKQHRIFFYGAYVLSTLLSRDPGFILVAISIGLLFGVLFAIKKFGGLVDPVYPTSSSRSLLSKGDVHGAWFRWWWANEVTHTLDTLIGPSFFIGVRPALRILYPDPDERKEAYERHLRYFNTQCNWGGGTITGVVLNLENARAVSILDGESPLFDSEAIHTTKTGMMGALAGIGDAVDSGNVQFLFIAAGFPFLLKGNYLGALLPWIGFMGLTYLYGWYFTWHGYRKGRYAALEIVGGKKTKILREVLTIAAMITLGAFGATVIRFPSPDYLADRFVNQDVLVSTLYSTFVSSLIFFILLAVFTKHGTKYKPALLIIAAIITLLAGIHLI